MYLKYPYNTKLMQIMSYLSRTWYENSEPIYYVAEIQKRRNIFKS